MNKNQVIIDIGDYMSTVSLLENGKLNEFYVEYGHKNNLLTGNIYKGRVVNVLSGLESAFIDIGLIRNGFLYVGETLAEKNDLKKYGLLPSQLNLKEGDYVMVQVTKEESQGKGARLSINMSIPGRYVVYLPTIDFIGVSNKIVDESLRDKLTSIIEKNKLIGEGFIARTVCKDAKKADILAEMKSIREQFKEIQELYSNTIGIKNVHSEGDLLFRTVRDMINNQTEAIICNDEGICDLLKEDFKKRHSVFFNRVHFFESDYDILDIFNIQKEVDKLLDRKVELVSGGSIVIDRTEALTAIDVNTGRFKGETDHEKSVFITNCEAAKEVARQLRLRNIGGIIVVDFIDMEEDEHKEKVIEILKNEVLLDRTKTRVLDMSPLGLVELTRKKTGSELSSFLLTECSYCLGSSKAPSNDYVLRCISVGLKRSFADYNYSSLLIKVNPAIFEYLFASRFFYNDCQTIYKDKRIYVVSDEHVQNGRFVLTGYKSELLTLPTGAKLLF